MIAYLVDLGMGAFLLINGPLVSLALVANVFYLLCLGRAKPKQPLKILLEFLIWTSIVFLFFIFLMYFVLSCSRSPLAHIVMWIFVLCSVHSSLMTTVWLSVYYCIQIVPLRTAFFLWVKKNIKLVIYAALLKQEVLIYAFGAANCADTIVKYTKYCNSTLAECEVHIFSYASGNYLLMVYVMVCLVLMTLSNFSLFYYLRSHMKKVAQGSNVTQKTASQLRAANAAVFQGVLYFTFCIFYFFNAFSYVLYSSLVIGVWLSLTCSTLYIFGCTVNLGIGQTLFRQRAVAVWRALAVHCGVGAQASE